MWEESDEDFGHGEDEDGTDDAESLEEFDEEPVPPRWPLHWRDLLPRERWIWFEPLWRDVCELQTRYRLPVRTEWWRDGVQLEALAAMAAWLDRYDSGEWDDPPGKLALLYDIERVAVLLRDGNEPFHPSRDWNRFTHHLTGIGCQPPPGR